MHFLLDTQIYLWCVSNDPSLSPKARSVLLAAESIHVSSASLWEIAIKVRLGKLTADVDKLIATLPSSGIHELPVPARHAALVATLPLHHGDPIDRMLVAQPMREPLHLLTADRQLPQYSPLVTLV